MIKNSRRGKGLYFLPFDRSNGRRPLAYLTRISKTLQVTQLRINFILPQRIVITQSIEVDDIAGVRTLDRLNRIGDIASVSGRKSVFVGVFITSYGFSALTSDLILFPWLIAAILLALI